MENSSKTLSKSLLKDSQSSSDPVGIEIAQEGKVDGQPDHQVYRKRKVKLYTTSVFIVVYNVFTIAASSGLLLCALWPLCERLDGNRIHLGFLVAMHSLGQFSCAIQMSTFAEQYKHRFTLILGCCCGIAGSLLWALCPVLGGLPMLYIAQFVLGVFSSSLGTARAFIVEQTRPNRRTYVLGRVSALGYAGHFATPIFGALLIALGDQMSSFMKFALPALVITLMCAILMYYLVYEMVDIKVEDEMTEEDYVVSAKADPAATVNTITYRNDSDVEKAVGSAAAYTPPEPAAPTITTTTTPSSPSSATPSPVTIPTSEANAISDQTNKANALIKARVRVFALVLMLNFTIRGCLAAYATLTTELLLNDFGCSYYELGGLLSGAGILGALQMLNLKTLWTNNFSDPMLFLIGCAVLGCAQVFVVNWQPEESPKLWQFSVALYAIMALGFPVAMCAALGSFSQLQRVGHQASHHATLIMIEAAANFVVPILSGVLEQTVRKFATFSFIMFMMAGSIIVVMVEYDSLMLLTDRSPSGGNSSGGGVTKVKPQSLVLDNVYVRYLLVLLSTFLVLAGFATFMVSVLGGRT